MTELEDPRVIDVLLVEDDEGDVLMTREAFEYYKIQNRLHVVAILPREEGAGGAQSQGSAGDPAPQPEPWRGRRAERPPDHAGQGQPIPCHAQAARPRMRRSSRSSIAHGPRGGASSSATARRAASANEIRAVWPTASQ